MSKEFQRLAAEEQLRVNAYTAQWQAHCDKIVESKNTEMAARVEETKKVYEFKLAEETAKTKEAQQMAKKASIAAALAVANQASAQVAAKNNEAKKVILSADIPPQSPSQSKKVVVQEQIYKNENATNQAAVVKS